MNQILVQKVILLRAGPVLDGKEGETGTPRGMAAGICWPRHRGVEEGEAEKAAQAR